MQKRPPNLKNPKSSPRLPNTPPKMANTVDFDICFLNRVKAMGPYLGLWTIATLVLLPDLETQFPRPVAGGLLITGIELKKTAQQPEAPQAQVEVKWGDPGDGWMK